MNLLNTLLVTALAGFLGSAAAAESIPQTLSVTDAYRAIPHKQTRFDLTAARMRPAEAVYLDDFFSLVDIAVVERVQTQMSLQSNREQGRDARNYPDVLQELAVLDVPGRLRDVHRLVTQAIEEQATYFDQWRANAKPRLDTRHPLIKSSNRKLIRAYQRLMKLYPKEGTHNRQAFFDHLCALDFI